MNTIDISYSLSEYSKIITRKEVKAFLNTVLSDLKLDNTEFSVSFVSEDEIRDLNKNYRSIDDSTDILSFASNDSIDGFEFITGPKRRKNIGDMVICIPVCFRNANTFNVSQDEELHRLLIHGVLHLSGENHLTNEIAKEPMLKKQEEMLKRLYTL